MESSEELDIQVEPREHSGLEIEISESSGLVVFEAVEDEVTGCVVRRERSRTEFAEQRQLRKGCLYQEWRRSERAGRNQEAGVVSREECVEKPCLIRNKTHSVAFSDEDIVVTLIREGSADGRT